MRSPAAGDAFDFAVRLWCEWRATGREVNEEPLLRQIQEQHRRRIPEIDNEVRSLTRRWGMNQCAEAEKDLNAHLVNRLRSRDSAPDAPELECIIRVQVSQEPLLRDIARHDWLLDAHRRSGQQAIKREVALLSERLKLWKDLLEQTEATPPPAVQLALRPGDQEAVLIGPVGQLPPATFDGHDPDDRSAERERELFRLAFQAFDVHRQHGTAEAVFRGESATRDLLNYVGITEVPPATFPEEDHVTPDESDDSYE